MDTGTFGPQSLHEPFIWGRGVSRSGVAPLPVSGGSAEAQKRTEGFLAASVRGALMLELLGGSVAGG